MCVLPSRLDLGKKTSIWAVEADLEKSSSLRQFFFCYSSRIFSEMLPSFQISQKASVQEQSQQILGGAVGNAQPTLQHVYPCFSSTVVCLQVGVPAWFSPPKNSVQTKIKLSCWCRCSRMFFPTNDIPKILGWF